MAMRLGLAPRLRQYMLLAITFVWAANSYYLGVLAERQQRAQEQALPTLL